MVGAIGSKALDDVIIFESTDKRILTFNNFVRRNSVRFAKNDTLLGKPVSSFIGPDLDTISFNIDLNAKYGIDPRAQMDRLIYIHRDGEIVSLVIGNKAFGVFRWRIVNLSMSWEHVDNMGFLISSHCEISLEEYV